MKLDQFKEYSKTTRKESIKKKTAKKNLINLSCVILC